MDRICGACGARQLAPFKDEAFEVEYQGRKTVVEGLSGERCAGCGEVFFDADSAQQYAAASDELVLAARENEREAIKRIRKKLGLTQAHAAFLTGGGPNAFSRYETGKTRPLPAVMHLFHLLDAHPELLRELPKPPARKQGFKTIRTHTFVVRRRSGTKVHGATRRRGGIEPAT